MLNYAHPSEAEPTRRGKRSNLLRNPAVIFDAAEGTSRRYLPREGDPRPLIYVLASTSAARAMMNRKLYDVYRERLV